MTVKITIHAPREGSDSIFCSRSIWSSRFQSTLPARGATDLHLGAAGALVISIHAPREGSDSGCPAWCSSAWHFNPRSPRGERPWQSWPTPLWYGFQSTLPARGATVSFVSLPGSNSISIHAPREGSDYRTLRSAELLALFQSTLPARGATQSHLRCTHSIQFQSTLPARGATWEYTGGTIYEDDFNPRSPRGERHDLRHMGGVVGVISIHAPREGSDLPGIRFWRLLWNFNPRSPRGERQLSRLIGGL